MESEAQDRIKNKRICSFCIGDASCSAWIAEHATKQGCSYDKRHNKQKAVSLEAFVEHVDEYFQQHYCAGTLERRYDSDSDGSYYEQRGNSLDDCLYEELDASDEIIADVSAVLPDFSWVDVAGGEEWFYESDLFEKIEDVIRREQESSEEYWYEMRHELAWEAFCKYVKFENRTSGAFEMLDQLFEDMFSDKEYQSLRSPLITLPEKSVVYRARKLSQLDTQKDVLKNKNFIFPPSCEKATVGRMNHAFIPIFYGAFSQDCAVIECQPYINQRVAVGEFLTQRSIKLFDFTVYHELYDHKYAKPKFEKYSDPRYTLINHMQKEISKPIEPDSKALDYIPTQIMTEYIRRKFGVDGIIFFSSLITPITNVDHRNIALFRDSLSDERRTRTVIPAKSTIWPVKLKRKSIQFLRIKRINFELEPAGLTQTELFQGVFDSVY
jgi:hypothetical protein